MRKFRSKFTSLLVVVMILTMMLSSVSVFAEIDDSMKEQFAQSSKANLEEIMQYDDATIAQLKEQGGVAMVVGMALEENLPIVGTFNGIEEVTVDDSDDEAIIVNARADFEIYDADIVLYYDVETYNLKNLEMNVDYPLGEKMKQASQNTLIGLGIVFVVLFFLMFVISLFKYVSLLDPANKKKAAPKAAPAAAPKAAPAAAPKAAPVAAPVAADDDDDEIVVVIAAAIAAAQAEAPSDTGYVVRSVRRTGTARRWKRG